ncbi:SpoIIE family protein phosphatase [Actinoplanes sp. NPDC026619]|uniref:SpoIIE family protein phosphatase n=1 Tax=Actinoplanes sp. NPDC026619 TaxID=3155798 RepID=UPI0033D67F1D
MNQALSTPADALIERAVGLLAGRARCHLDEAYHHLETMATDQRREVAEVAAGVIRVLDVKVGAPGRHASVPQMVAAALTDPARPSRARRSAPWVSLVQRVLDNTPGMCGYLSAERDRSGRILDLIWQAASPGAATPDGQRGRQLIGQRASGQFPSGWDVYQDVLDSGCPAAVGPFRYGDGHYTVRAQRLGHGLLLQWSKLDELDRFGNLGWGEWDLATGEVFWSENMYRIYEREPHLGPLSGAETDALTEPGDAARIRSGLVGLGVDTTVRVSVNGRIKQLRTVADAVRDGAGRPVRVYAIVQDVTDRDYDTRRIAEVEQQLTAEHRLAGHLQRIILPIPEEPIELPGLKVAVRYLPAGQESFVGGDWYQATRLRDGSVLLAVGDVAGHGTQAATTMAQLRHALRALAVTTGDPGVLLGHLNRLTCELERENPELSATAVVARFDPEAGEITWAQAGHPPPLLSRGGRTMPLERPPGPILGVVDDAVYPTSRLSFRIGDVLLLYTDGLVEHRHRGPDDGLAQVIRTVDEAVHASPQQPLAQLLARLQQTNPDDDTCILAARPVTGETRDLRHHLRRR